MTSWLLYFSQKNIMWISYKKMSTKFSKNKDFVSFNITENKKRTNFYWQEMKDHFFNSYSHIKAHLRF